MLGVEIIEDAINDAKFNAAENDIQNAKFYAGNCDDYIHWLVHEAKNENLLAILDPPRAGIRKWISFVVVVFTPYNKMLYNISIAEPRSKEALRNSRGLDRIVYIACAPKSALHNWIDLSRPCSKSLKGEPFVLKEAAAVDMFPHTDHVEMVLLFERLQSKPKTENKPMESDKTDGNAQNVAEKKENE